MINALKKVFLFFFNPQKVVFTLTHLKQTKVQIDKILIYEKIKTIYRLISLHLNLYKKSNKSYINLVYCKILLSLPLFYIIKIVLYIFDYFLIEKCHQQQQQQ